MDKYSYKTHGTCSREIDFEVDFVLNDKHRPVIINNNSSFKIDELNEIFHFNNLEKHKTR